MKSRTGTVRKEALHCQFVSAPFNYLCGNDAAVLEERNLTACRCTREGERERFGARLEDGVVGKFAIFSGKEAVGEYYSLDERALYFSWSVGRWPFSDTARPREDSECWSLRQKDFKTALVG